MCIQILLNSCIRNGIQVNAIVPRPEEQELLIPGKLTSRQRQLADSCRTREAPRSTRENLQRRVVRNAINLLSAWCDADSRNCIFVEPVIRKRNKRFKVDPRLQCWRRLRDTIQTTRRSYIASAG